MPHRRWSPRPDLQRVLAEARYLPRTLRLVRDAAGRWTPVWGVLLLCQGLLPALALQLTKQVVDALADTAEVPSLARVRAAVHAAGAEAIVERLPHQYGTWLGKEFENGTELSGGGMAADCTGPRADASRPNRPA